MHKVITVNDGGILLVESEIDIRDTPLSDLIKDKINGIEVAISLLEFEDKPSGGWAVHLNKKEGDGRPYEVTIRTHDGEHVRVGVPFYRWNVKISNECYSLVLSFKQEKIDYNLSIFSYYQAYNNGLSTKETINYIHNEQDLLNRLNKIMEEL